MSVLAPGILRSFLDFWEICVPRITTIIILTCGLRYSGMSRSADCNLPTFRDSLSVPSSKSIRPRRLTHEYGTDRPSRNVGSCPETLVTYYQSTLRNIPEERRPHLHRGGSMKSRNYSATLSLSVNYNTLLIQNSLRCD